MPETPQAKPSDLSMKEVAGFMVDLADRLTKVEKSGGSGEAVEEQLRAYRLLRMENESAKNFAEGFFNRSEPLMERLASAEETVAKQIDEATSTAMGVIKSGRQSVEGSKKLMMQVLSDAQETQGELRRDIQELKAAQEDLRTMQNTMTQRWNEQSQQITAANVEKAAGEAAAKAFSEMNKAAIKEEVARQVRMMMSDNGGD